MNDILLELTKNKEVFKAMLSNTSKEAYLWKPSPSKWCMLEVVCHLYDEEREDFRARVKSVLETPEKPLRPINPVAWVSERKYLEKNFDQVLKDFLKERDQSIKWLSSLKEPQWHNINIHPEAGERSARMFLSNWLAHDYIHLRQINRLKYGYFEQKCEEDLNYAGNW